MKQLLVDVGNSRIKWALLRARKVGALHAIEMRGATARSIARALDAARGAGRVVVVNVAGPRGERLVRAALRILALPAPLMIRSGPRAAGVANGYPEAWRLGADRWVAVIGAHHLARGRAVCVASVGTALTLDLVDGQGRHRGGLIVPGPELMRRSLLDSTSGIRRRATVGQAPARRARGFFARNTAAALQIGPLNACAALIDTALGESRTLLGARPLLLVTGGGAKSVASALRSRHLLQPDLVLQGLAVLARGELTGSNK
jgi:type III pantothenate kinase